MDCCCADCSRCSLTRSRLMPSANAWPRTSATISSRRSGQSIDAADAGAADGSGFFPTERKLRTNVLCRSVFRCKSHSRTPGPQPWPCHRDPHWHTVFFSSIPPLVREVVCLTTGCKRPPPRSTSTSRASWNSRRLRAAAMGSNGRPIPPNPAQSWPNRGPIAIFKKS